MPELIGWSASLILVLTIAYQVSRQWRSGTSEGVSKWLFIGQIAASSGFTTYSVMIGDVVFIVTNLVLLLSAIVGLTIVLVHHARDRRGE